MKMTQYRKKPVVIEATQWFKNGDHPEDHSDRRQQDADEVEGLIVRYFREPETQGASCQYCFLPLHNHGWIDNLEGGHRVCPEDWIITGVKGEKYPCKPDIFEQTYEAVEDGT